MTEYTIVKRMSPGLIGMHSTYGYNLFVLAKLRKPRNCASCSEPISKGSQVWYPLTNGYNRKHRLCTHCVPVV